MSFDSSSARNLSPSNVRYTAADLAKRAKRSVRSIQRDIASGLLKGSKCGGKTVTFSQKNINAYERRKSTAKRAA
jgi:predicted DNA-binding transcriptional regulator YafY